MLLLADAAVLKVSLVTAAATTTAAAAVGAAAVTFVSYC